MRGRIVIAGSLAQRPHLGGHTWVFLQYLLGFRRLGWDVLFLDWLDPEMCMDGGGHPSSLEDSANVSYFLEVMNRFGLNGAFCLMAGRDGPCIGLTRREVRERLRSSALLLNVMGYLQDEELLACAPRRVFLDIDPGFGQMWRELGLHDSFHGHDAFVTIGENIGCPGCGIPTCGLDWITTPQPVVLDYWPVANSDGGDFTSVATWRGPFGPVDYDGRTYGLRVHEFRRFVSLPRLSAGSFRLALDIDSADVQDRALLTANGWTLEDPRAAARDPWNYRDYLHRSGAEFDVAKNMYVRTHSGWISDRSLCYLASGKPVVAQDTGFRERYPVGKGLIPFTTLEEALAGVEEIGRDHHGHARAARALACEFFDSDKVLGRLLAKLAID
jgi:hypothetical protein